MDSFRHVVALVLVRLGTVLAVPALGSGVWTYFAYEQMVEPLGWGLKGRFIALIGAVTVTTLYWAGGWMLIRLVPPMRRVARWLALPCIAAFMTLVIGASSVPQVKLFYSPAKEAQIVDHVANVSLFNDSIKQGVQKGKSLGPVLETVTAKIEVLAKLELEGKLSGVAAAGGIYASLASMAADVREVAKQLASGGSEAELLIGRMDGTVGAMRQAGTDRNLSFEARGKTFEGHGDSLRSVSIELSQKMPLIAVGALARRMQTEAIVPALSKNPNVQERQERTLSTVQPALQAMGRDLEALVGPIAAILEKGPPIYVADAPEILIFKYWHVLIQAWTVSLSVDLFIIVLLWLACVAADEARAQEKSSTRGPLAAEVHQMVTLVRELETLFRREPSPIGEHPYPLAAAARERAQRAPGNGRTRRPSDNDDQGGAS